MRILLEKWFGKTPDYKIRQICESNGWFTPEDLPAHVRNGKDGHLYEAYLIEYQRQHSGKVPTKEGVHVRHRGVKSIGEDGKMLEMTTTSTHDTGINHKTMVNRGQDEHGRWHYQIESSNLKLYSVLITEEELKLFSEFLEQREFENNVSNKVRLQHPFNEEREKDASEFTSKVMQRFEEKSKASDSKSSKRERIVTSPGSSKKISELTDEEKDSLLNSLSSNLEGNGESPKMIYNIKRFSRLSKLRDEIRSNNKLRDSFTEEDYKNHLNMRESSAKFARESVTALKDPNHEFTKSYEGQPKALKESIEFNENLDRNETAAAKLLKEDPKKYFKKYAKHHNRQAVKNFISDSLGLGYKEEKW